MIIKLDSGKIPGVEEVGGKARNLMLLRKHGFPVPAGFCITCSAYDLHFGKRLTKVFEELQKVKKPDRLKALARLSLLITEHPIDPRLAEELQKHYAKLKAPLMAVRSSATCEDQVNLSFAGQYETVLAVSSFDGLQKAIKRCWMSLWGERVYEYCLRNRIDHSSIKMAVIVQQQVPADFAGVCFTQDPATGRKDRVVIEYVPGLGDKLVSGRATPERVTVSKRGGKTLTPGSKLGPKIIKKLSRQAVRIEKRFKAPQDIEWASSGKKLYLLQTRPVTATVQAEKWEDRQVWTNANTGEVLPDAATPMSWSMVMPYVNAIFDAFLDFIGAGIGDIELIGRIAGRAYFNLNSLTGMLRSIPGFRKFDITSVFGGEQGDLGDLRNVTLADEDIPKIRFKMSRAFLYLPLRTLRFIFFNPVKGMKILDRHRIDVERMDRLDLKTLSDEQLFEIWHGMDQRIYSTIRQLGFIAVSMMFYTNLDKLCQRWFKGRPGEHINPLLAGIGDIEPAKAGLALYGLSRICRKHPAVLRRVTGREKWSKVKPRLVRVKGGEEFLQAWRDFMVRYGHHTRSEIELSYPRWSESPDFVLSMVRNYLKAGPEGGDPAAHYDAVAERRLKLTAELRGRLDPFKRMIFDYFLRNAQQGSQFRENMKNMFMRVWIVIRRVILEFGERLKRKGVISKVEDVFFLDMNEVDPLLKGIGTAGARKAVKDRRAEYERFQDMAPPKVIRGVFDPQKHRPAEPVRGQKVLTGLAVSPGVVKGKARVILDTRSRETVRPGEILVAPFTDPGWTPYFMSAAAIVVDMGGLLSHGSIVAREYGIPAVVNVGPATKVIQTGQVIEVDGTRGVVTIV